MSNDRSATEHGECAKRVIKNPHDSQRFLGGVNRGVGSVVDFGFDRDGNGPTKFRTDARAEVGGESDLVDR